MKNLKFGTHLDQNPEYRSYMEDTLFLDNSSINKYFLFGLFDGHGGAFVSETLKEKFPQVFNEFIQNCKDISQNHANKELENDEKAVECGSTGIVGIIYPDPKIDNKLYLNIANVGDSSGYIFDNKYGYRLSYDHKASDKVEKERIENNSGQIFFNRVQGILAITRAFGDFLLKNFGVTSEPFTQKQPIELSKQYEFIVFASDGVWDSYSNDDRITYMAAQLQEKKNLDCKDIAKYLLDEAKRDTRDNLSIIVIKLR